MSRDVWLRLSPKQGELWGLQGLLSWSRSEMMLVWATAVDMQMQRRELEIYFCGSSLSYLASPRLQDGNVLVREETYILMVKG